MTTIEQHLETSKNSVSTKLNQMVDQLYTNHGLAMFKAGSEWENMNLDEIIYLHKLGTYDIPLLMKVSGVEARTEMRQLLQAGVDMFLAPMVESEYALEKFITIAQEVGQEQQKTPKTAIMIESIQTYHNLESIINSPYFAEVEKVVLGRWDLANSMGTTNVDSPEVKTVCQKIVNAVQTKNKSISVGGFVNPRTAPSVKKELGANMLNTINFLLDIDKCGDISQAVELMLQAEIAYYTVLQQINPRRAKFYQSRIDITNKKLYS